MDNTKLLQRINELGKELNLDNLCELKRLYSRQLEHQIISNYEKKI